MSDIRIINLSGFMLGDEERSNLRPGQQWWPHDTMVYVCKNLDVAKRILQESQCWMAIYHVTAPRIECVDMDRDFFWTTDASKIIVCKPVFQQMPKRITEKELLDNAKIMRNAFMKNMQKGKQK